MRPIITTFLFIISLSLLQAGVKNIEIHLEGYAVSTTQLGGGISANVLYFDNAVLDDAFGMLPVHVERIPLKDPGVKIIASLSGISSHVFEDENLISLSDAKYIAQEFKLLTSVVFIEGNPYAEVLILPFRNLNEEKVEVLDACTLQVEISHDASSQMKSGSFVEESVLATGSWYRLSTDKDAVYRITYEDLEAMGIDPATVDPKKIRIFGNGNGIVPEKNSDDRYDDLMENAIYVHGEDDGVFNEDDYILFYGESSITWNYVPFEGYGIFLHEINPYTDHTYYFLNTDLSEGKRIAEINNSGLTPTQVVESFSDYQVIENDDLNILKTGREWYGEVYGDQTSYDYNFTFPNIDRDYKVSLLTNVAARSTVESRFDYYHEEEHLLQAPVSKIILSTIVYAWTTTPDSVGFYPSSDNITIRVDYDKPESTSTGWMNYVALNARRDLRFTGSYMRFRDHLSDGDSEVAEYRISGSNENLQVWDVTDPLNISLQHGELSGDQYSFIAPSDEIREYLAFDGSGFETPMFIEKVENQNLHSIESVQYIILAYPEFMNAAERMLSLHTVYDGLQGLIVTPQEVYNEFGSGKQDPAAIRDFVRMLYERGDPENNPIYLLLLGDASYDYKDRIPGNTNLIPTYHSVESLKLGYSFVTDDYFGLLDPGDGVNAVGKSVEIGIGRFPVHTVEQAEQMVDKIESYLSMKPEILNDWRNDVYFIADDEDRNLHFDQAEKLQYMLDTGYQVYNRNKIYFDAFPQVSTPSGDRYPDVNDAINRMMDKGAFIVNYTGHGGETGWAAEKVLDIPTINKWTNWNRLPLYITATCEFSRFDDPSMISAGEWVFLNPSGGGIGLLTTSRLAYADPNFRLNKAVYRFMFQQDANGDFYKIGDIVRLAKTDQNNGTSIKNFVLLGDPALRLAYPEYHIETSEINGIPVNQPGDTLTAMSEVIVSGYITDYHGDTLDDFNGRLYPTVYDKDLVMTTLGNDPLSFVDQFDMIGPKLFEGKVSVIGGRFSFSFFMPQAMATNYGFAKISYYAYDTTDYRDAHGYYKVKTGGVNPDAVPDNDGPEIMLYLNNTEFNNGGYTDNEPVFLAYLYDEHGINYTGNAIGRDITLTLDGNPQSTVIINSAFDPDMDSYQSGWISYPMSELEDGKHTLTLCAWDNMNNMSEKTIDFEVNVNGEINLTNVMNYPNPFHDITYFTFDHNKPGNVFDVEIRIFNVMGQHVTTLWASSPASGASISPIEWDGTDMRGNLLDNGTYIYRMYVTDDAGSQYVQSSKLIFVGNN